MDSRAGNEGQRPLVAQAEQSRDEVDDLQGGDGLDGAVEVLGQEVPEDLGPEEGLDGCGNLV